MQAAIEASRLRLRPILMTSFAFIMGVVPLVISTGAGAEMRHAMGVAVFAGMLGVTLFGIFLTPVFYVLLRQLSGNRPLKQHGEVVSSRRPGGTGCPAGRRRPVTGDCPRRQARGALSPRSASRENARRMAGVLFCGFRAGSRCDTARP